MDKESVKLDSTVTQYLSEIKNKGETSVVVAKNRKIVGIIEIADVLRTEAKQAVAELKKLGTLKS
jgi:cation transport ATPase